MAISLYYLAYSSNLHPRRLVARVPSARPLGHVKLQDLELSFHKRSVDGSGKCTLSERKGAVSHGVLYEFASDEKPLLDAVEGTKGYLQQQMKCSVSGVQYLAYLYVASSTHLDPSLVPYEWYKQLVIAGARYHNFPLDYLSALSAIPSRPDLDSERATSNEKLVRDLFSEEASVHEG